MVGRGVRPIRARACRIAARFAGRPFWLTLPAIRALANSLAGDLRSDTLDDLGALGGDFCDLATPQREVFGGLSGDLGTTVSGTTGSLAPPISLAALVSSISTPAVASASFRKLTLSPSRVML